MRFNFLVFIALFYSLLFAFLYSGERLILANNLAAKGNLKQAEIAYLSALEDENESKAIIHYNLANLYYRMGDTGKAAMSYRKVIEIAPQFKNAYHNLGKLYFQAEDYSEAILTFYAYRRYQEMVEVEPSLFDAYETAMLIGDTAYAMENYWMAVVEYRNANEIAPEEIDPYLMLSELYFTLGDREYGLEILALGEKQVENPVRLISMRAEIYNESQEYEAALESYSALVALLRDRLQSIDEELTVNQQNFKKSESLLRDLNETLKARKANVERIASEDNNALIAEINASIRQLNVKMQGIQRIMLENEEKIPNLQRQLSKAVLFQAEAFAQAGYNNLAIYTLQEVIRNGDGEKKNNHSSNQIVQAVQLLGGIYQEEGRIEESFQFFQDFFLVSPNEIYAVIKNLLVRAYNEDKLTLQKDILKFYNQYGLVDDVSQLLSLNDS